MGCLNGSSLFSICLRSTFFYFPIPGFQSNNYPWLTEILIVRRYLAT